MPISRQPHFFPAFLAVLFVLPVFVLWVGVAHGQSPDPGSEAPQIPTYLEEEAQRIDGMLMCPVCPAETIGQAQVEIAQQMRRLVREKLSQGESRQEILDFFADRYGKGILAAPPKSGVNLVAWLVPVIGVLGALAAGLMVIRSMTHQGASASVTGTARDDDLAPYLDIIDRDLGLGGSDLPGETENWPQPDFVAGSETDTWTGDPETPLQDVR